MSETMKLANKLYQEEVVVRINELDPVPYVVELDPTAACDLACPGCISEDLIALGNRFTDERLISLGWELIIAGVRAVILIGGGEPLAHRKIGDFIELMGNNDVHIGITTNGSFIDRHLDRIAKFSKWTRVSMDTATEETFGRLRPTKGGKNKFNHIVQNMVDLASVKTGKLGYSFLIQTPADGKGIETNIGEIYDAARLSRDIGCDYFEVKPTYQFRDGVAHALQKHDKGLMRWAAEEVARLDELETASFKIIRAINLKPSLEGVETPQPKDYHVCPSTMLRTTITPTGTFVCPYWRGKEPMRTGDPVKQSFAEIWKGDRRAKVMTTLDPSRDCNFHCLRHETNQTVFALREALFQSNGVRLETVDEFDRFI